MTLWKRALLAPLWTTTDARRAERSRLVWGLGPRVAGRQTYRLSLLGVINGGRSLLGREPWGIRR